jgi:hypothetical protein
VRLNSLRPKSGPNGGIAVRYRVADNTVGVGFLDPAKRIKPPSYQTVMGYTREDGRNICFEGTVRVCKVSNDGKTYTIPKPGGGSFVTDNDDGNF